MRTKILTTLLPLAFCMTLALGVQAKSGKKSSSYGQTSVTGCLQTGTSPNSYVLNNVNESTTKSSMNKSGQTPNEMARSESSSSYTLIPEGKNINLQNWVGQRVRVTGRMSSSSSQSSSSSGSSSSMDNSSSMSGSMSGSEFMVSSIHKSTGTCQ
jgi:hypothetical protein